MKAGPTRSVLFLSTGVFLVFTVISFSLGATDRIGGLSSEDPHLLPIGKSEAQEAKIVLTIPVMAKQELIGSFIFLDARVTEATELRTLSANLSEEVRDAYVGATVTFTSGVLKGVARRVVAYDGQKKILTVDPPFPGMPAFGDRFVLLKQTQRVSLPPGTFSTPVRSLTQNQRLVIRDQIHALVVQTDVVSDAVMTEEWREEDAITFEQLLFHVSAGLEALYTEVGYSALETVAREELFVTVTDAIKTREGIRKKLLDIRAATDVLYESLEAEMSLPIVHSFVTSHAKTHLHFVVANPLTTTQTVSIEAILPREVKPADVILPPGFEIEHDDLREEFRIVGTVRVDPGAVALRSTAMEDVWFIHEDDMAFIERRATTLAADLAKTRFEPQARLLEGSVKLSLALIDAYQQSEASVPQERIAVFRENVKRLEDAEVEMNALNELVLRTAETRIQERTVSTLLYTLGMLVLFMLTTVLFVLFLALAHRRHRANVSEGRYVSSREKHIVFQIPRRTFRHRRTEDFSRWLTIATGMLASLFVISILGFFLVQRAIQQERTSLETLVDLEREAVNRPYAKRTATLHVAPGDPSVVQVQTILFIQDADAHSVSQ